MRVNGSKHAQDDVNEVDNDINEIDNDHVDFG